MATAFKFESSKYPLLVFIGISSYLICFSRLGVDFTDCGYHIQSDYEIWNYRVCLSPMWFCTNFAGGLWQALSPVGKNLQWLYIGGSFLWGLIALFIFFILRTLFYISDRILLVCVFGAFLSIPIFQLDMLIQYYTFPLLLAMVYFLLFVRLACKIGKLEIQAGGLGLFYIMMIASRFPLILFGGIPVFYYLFRGAIKREWNINWKWVICFCIGLFVGLLLLSILFASVLVNTVYTEHHWLEAVGWVLSTARKTFFSWGLIFPLFAGFWFLSLLPLSKTNLKLFMLLILCFVGVCFFAMYRYPSAVRFMKTYYLFFFLNGMSMVLLVGVLANNYFRTWYFSKKDIKISDSDFLLLVLTFFAAFCVFPLGTNTGIKKDYYALFPLLAILNALLWSSVSGNSNLKKVCPIFLLLVLPLFGAASTMNYSYREGNKLHLNTIIDIPALRNIKTSQNHALELSKAYAGIKPLVKEGEIMLVTDNNYLWNWVLDTKCFVTWINYKPLESILSISDITLPDSILLIKQSTRSFPGYKEHLEWFRDSFLPDHYTNVYTDDYCELYRNNNIFFMENQ